MDHFPCSNIRFQVDLQIHVCRQISLAFLKAADAGDFALLFTWVGIGFGLGAEAHLPMGRPRAVLVLEVVEIPGLQEHELFELQILNGQVRMDDLCDAVSRNNAAKGLVDLLVIGQI